MLCEDRIRSVWAISVWEYLSKINCRILQKRYYRSVAKRFFFLSKTNRNWTHIVELPGSLLALVSVGTNNNAFTLIVISPKTLTDLYYVVT